VLLNPGALKDNLEECYGRPTTRKAEDSPSPKRRIKRKWNIPFRLRAQNLVLPNLWKRKAEILNVVVNQGSCRLGMWEIEQGRRSPGGLCPPYKCHTPLRSTKRK